MRVISGSARGHILRVPKGVYVRPATDLVRGAIFSMLESMNADFSRVLDLYAGSGAMGIEALSRGAGRVDFVDREPRCCAIIKQNLDRTGLGARARVYCCSVTRALTFLEGEYGIVLMDPPYADSSIGNVIAQLARSPLVTEDSVIIVTHSPRLTLEPSYEALTLSRELRHGDSCIAVFRKDGGV